MNYKKYHLSAKEWLFCFGEYITVTSIISYLFYDSLLVMVMVFPFFFLFIKWDKKRKCKKREEKLEEEFLKALQSIATSLAAGFSPENAFIEAQFEMERLMGKTSIMVQELMIINRRVSFGERLEKALADFAERACIEQIEDLAVIFSVAHQSGGSFSRIILNCIDIMEASRVTKEEIKILIRGKQYEQRIMSIVPLGIILYLKVSSSDFISVLYHNIPGNIIMTVCLVIYILSVLLSERLYTIDI